MQPDQIRFKAIYLFTGNACWFPKTESPGSKESSRQHLGQRQWYFSVKYVAVPEFLLEWPTSAHVIAPQKALCGLKHYHFSSTRVLPCTGWPENITVWTGAKRHPWKRFISLLNFKTFWSNFVKNDTRFCQLASSKIECHSQYLY